MTAFGEILKATSLVGGASLISMVILMVRNKAAAVLIGPEGLGLMGVFNAITSMVVAATGLGLGSSAVRQIAAACGTGDADHAACIVGTLRRMVRVTAAVGLMVMVSGAALISRVTLASSAYALPISILGAAVFFAQITAGQAGVLQGHRRIGELAKITILNALITTALSSLCFWIWREDGIVISVVLSAGTNLFTSWLYARRIPIRCVAMPWARVRAEAGQLLTLGAPLMLSGSACALTGYLVNTMLARQFGLAGVGIWQAAVNLSVLIANFVLGAMGQDFFPRLANVAGDDERIREEVNVQTEVSLLLATPCLGAVVAFAPLVIHFFYSEHFAEAAGILRWTVWGVFGRVLSYPLGYVLLAKNCGRTFLLTEILNNAAYVLGVLLLTPRFGVHGAGMAFLLQYVVFTIVNYLAAHRVSKVTWGACNALQAAAFAGILVGLGTAWPMNPRIGFGIRFVALGGLGFYCLRRLLRKAGLFHGFHRDATPGSG